MSTSFEPNFNQYSIKLTLESTYLNLHSLYDREIIKREENSYYIII